MSSKEKDADALINASDTSEKIEWTQQAINIFVSYPDGLDFDRLAKLAEQLALDESLKRLRPCCVEASHVTMAYYYLTKTKETMMVVEQALPRQRYRKITPTVARVLTEQDYQTYKGVIQTHEGPKAFLPGDYLATDGLGSWPIPIETIRAHYERVGAVDEKGYVTFLSREIREAVQMPEPFTINGLTGQPGDYLVFGHGSAWPVERSQFERSYALIESGE